MPTNTYSTIACFFEVNQLTEDDCRQDPRDFEEHLVPSHITGKHQKAPRPLHNIRISLSNSSDCEVILSIFKTRSPPMWGLEKIFSGQEVNWTQVCGKLSPYCRLLRSFIKSSHSNEQWELKADAFRPSAAATGLPLVSCNKMSRLQAIKCTRSHTLTQWRVTNAAPRIHYSKGIAQWQPITSLLAGDDVKTEHLPSSPATWASSRFQSRLQDVWCSLGCRDWRYQYARKSVRWWHTLVSAMLVQSIANPSNGSRAKSVVS